VWRCFSVLVSCFSCVGAGFFMDLMLCLGGMGDFEPGFYGVEGEVF